jgi:hypothetical protein
MANTTFSSGTVVASTWLNEVNTLVWGTLPTLKLYLAVGDDSTDDSTAIQNAIDAVALLGGGTVLAVPNKIYKCTVAPIIKNNVTLDMQMSTLHLTLSGTNSEGVKLRTNSRLVNFVINTTSSGSPGSQGGIHSGITIGPLYGNGGTVASPSVDEGVYGWSIENGTISTSGVGKQALTILGGASHGTIRNITFPDSSTISAAIGMDWGYVGTLNTATDAGIVAGKIAFLASTMYTTHPHDITISDIKIGNLSYTQSMGVRMSGVYNITVRNVEIASTTYAGFYHTAGDAGFEFAPTSIKPFRHKGICLYNYTVKAANNGWGVFCDAYADNVASAITNLGYVNILAPINQTDIKFTQVYTYSAGGASVQEGFRFQNQIGGGLFDCEASGHSVGILFDMGVNQAFVQRGRFYSNRTKGIYVHHSSSPPQDIHIDNAVVYNNDTAATTTGGIVLDSCVRAKVTKCILGVTGESTQDYGIYVTTSAVEADVQDNYVEASVAFAYGLASSTTYGCVWLFKNNKVNTSVTTQYSGQNIVPIERTIDPIDFTVKTTWRAKRLSLSGDITPTTGAWVVGDRIEYVNPTSSSYIGTVCVTAGSPGTWKQYGATTA